RRCCRAHRSWARPRRHPQASSRSAAGEVSQRAPLFGLRGCTTTGVTSMTSYRPAPTKNLEPRPLKLTIVAATGGTGQHLLSQALAAGHDVSVVVRNPARRAEGVPAVRVDVTDPAPVALKTGVEGADAVVSALGPRGNAEAGVASTGARALIGAMQATG